MTAIYEFIERQNSVYKTNPSNKLNFFPLKQFIDVVSMIIGKHPNRSIKLYCREEETKEEFSDTKVSNSLLSRKVGDKRQTENEETTLCNWVRTVKVEDFRQNSSL